MMAKTEYKVLVPCQSDTKKKSHGIGDIVSEKDFPKKILNGWVEIGVLEPIMRGEEDAD